MLGTFLKDFPSRQLPKGIFLSGNFQNVQFSRAVTSQVCPNRSARSLSLFLPRRSAHLTILAAALGPCGASEGLTFWKLPLGKLHTLELGSCTLENVRLGKYNNTLITTPTPFNPFFSLHSLITAPFNHIPLFTPLPLL